MKKWLFNPFVYVAGGQSLLAGIAFIIITAAISYFSHTCFDGVVDVHPLVAPFWVYLAISLIDWGCSTILFYSAGRIFSRSSIRFIDVAGTVALARWVMIFAALAGFGIDAYKMMAAKTLPLSALKDLITPGFMIASLLQLLMIIWLVALTYQAFSVSCNLKSPRAAWIFTGTIILAEISSKIVVHFII